MNRRQLAGFRAKRAGENWENLFESGAWRAGCKVIKIPSGCKWVSATKQIPIKSPFDFVIIKSGKSIFIDTKSSNSKAFTYSDCDQTQIYWLSQCAAGGCRSGYIVQFRALKLTVFYSVERLAGLKPRQSLKPEDGVQLSGDNDRLEIGRLFYEQRSEEAQTVTK